MSPQWYNSYIIDIEDISPTTKSFTIEIEDIDSINFEPGQFVVMDLPLGDKRKDRWRSYSIANAPNGTNKMEFCIVHVEEGLGSSYLFEQGKIGSTIRFKSPSGTFVLPKLNRSNVFISTGTGVAPFRSMMQYIEMHNLHHEPIHIIFGTRYNSGILYREEFSKWAQHKNVKYSVALSREKDIPEDKEGIFFHSGYVHDIYKSTYKEVDAGTHFYLCGWTNMIDEAVANLVLKMNYPKEQIHYELYG